MTMRPWRWLLVNLIVGVLTAATVTILLGPHIGHWQGTAIGVGCALIAVEYVDHRREIHDRRKKK
jgi:hypothetical protein